MSVCTGLLIGQRGDVPIRSIVNVMKSQNHLYKPSFHHILTLFQDCCGDDFKLELDKWNMDPDLISDCCWIQYRRSVSVHRESGVRGQDVRGQGLRAENGGVQVEDQGGAGGEGTPRPDWRKTAWDVLENTDPSWYTKV